MNEDQIRIALQEALTSWLDKKFSEFGWFSLKTIGVAALGALVYFILIMDGWHK